MERSSLRGQQRDRHGAHGWGRARGDGDALESELTREDLWRPGVRLLNCGGFANADVLAIPTDAGTLVVKDYGSRSAWVRWFVAPLLIRHELAILQCLEGLPGLPRPEGRIDRLALAMEFIEGVPLRRRMLETSLPRAFFDALEGILEGLALRGVAHLDLRSTANILVTRPTGAPALLDFAAAYRLPIPRRLIRYLERRALEKLRIRYESEGEPEKRTTRLRDYQELELGRTRFCFLDRGRRDDPVPAVFLHDIGYSAEIFRGFIESGGSHSRRGIGIDLPGFGRSKRRLLSLTPWRVAGELERLIDALRIGRIDVVGHGWGGLVAREMAARSPERVRCVVTIDSPLRRAEVDAGRRQREALRHSDLLRRRLLRELPPDLSEAQRGVLEWAVSHASRRTLHLAYRGIPAGRNGDAKAEENFVRVAAPRQPWLVVRSSSPDPESHEEVLRLGARDEFWTQPFSEPARIWQTLEKLAGS